MPSFFCMSIARPRLMWAGVIWLGLPSIDVEADVHLRHRLERLDQGVADEVGERHLAAAGAGQVVVDHDAVVPEQLDRHGADRGGGGHRQRVVHVGDGAGRGAAQHGVGRLVDRRGRRRSLASPWAPATSVPLAGSAAAESGRGVAFGAAFASASVPFSGPCPARVGGLARGGLGGPCRVVRRRRRRGLGGLRGRRRRGGAGRRLAAGVAGAPFEAPFVLEPFVLKYAAQLGSTLPGSRWNWSYISSTSHSLAPKSEEGAEAVRTKCRTGWSAAAARVVSPLPGRARGCRDLLPG